MYNKKTKLNLKSLNYYVKYYYLQQEQQRLVNLKNFI